MTLKLRNVSKTFGGQTALRTVDLDVAYGTVHALAGQNGSGKSTLIKLLSGYHQPDDGATMEIEGSAVTLGDGIAARQAGLRFVHQDLALIANLSVIDNMMLGRTYPSKWGGRIHWEESARQVDTFLAQLGVDVDPRAPIASLSVSQRSAVAIARALSDTRADGDRLLIVLDEPTAALPANEVDHLLRAIRGLRDEGHGVLLVTHHLNEVLDVADHISVLRDGQLISSTPRRDVDYARLTELIVGHPVIVPESGIAREQALADRPAALTVRGLNGARIELLDLEVAAGEIVGFAGIDGSGRESLAPLLAGGLPHRGTVRLGGDVLPSGDPARAMRAGLTAVPGERARHGVFANFSVRENLTLSDLARFRRLGRVRRSREKLEVDDWINRLGIVTNSSEAPIGSLSGGNQQKVLVARALRLAPRVLVLDDPTQGIDIGARAQLHDVVERCAADGMAIVLVSTDSDELSRLSDRVHVLVGGRIARTLERGPSLTAAAIDSAQLQEPEQHHPDQHQPKVHVHEVVSLPPTPRALTAPAGKELT